LLPSSPELWANKINAIIQDNIEFEESNLESLLLLQDRKISVASMKEKAKKRVQTHFSDQAFSETLMMVLIDMED